MVLKFLLRFIDGMEMYRNWAKREAVSLVHHCENLNPDIWRETLNFQKSFEQWGTAKIKSTGVRLGGGGAYTFLYFICRIKKPQTVVETGVAAGWTSAAILNALAENGSGKLYSSDLPYRKRPGADKFIGMLVEDGYKKNWDLYTNGDKKALPEILEKVERVNLFHFDSDKSYRGREFAFKTIKRHLSKDAVLVFDDIQDNFHFKDLVEQYNLQYFVFEFEGKFFGVIYLNEDNPFCNTPKEKI